MKKNLFNVKRNKMNKMINNRGFALIDPVGIIAIIAILTAVIALVIKLLS